MTTKKIASKDISQGDVPIDLQVDEGFLVARWCGHFGLAELVWWHLHNNRKNSLALKTVASLPRQFERELADAWEKEGLAIALRIDGSYIVATAPKRKDVFKIIWERRHGAQENRLVLERCPEIPRQFEVEVFGDAHPTEEARHGRR